MQRPPKSMTEIEALFALAVCRPDVSGADTCIARISIPIAVQLSTLLSIKTGGCSEDCGYCPQSARYDAGVENQGCCNLDDVLAAAQAAKAAGAVALLHGRGMARAEAARSRTGAGNGAGGARRWAWKPAPRWAC